MIQELSREGNAERIQKFICVLHNGETYVTWQKDKDAAAIECERRSGHGKAWKILAYPAWI